jgi:hypothetical protein
LTFRRKEIRTKRSSGQKKFGENNHAAIKGHWPETVEGVELKFDENLIFFGWSKMMRKNVERNHKIAMPEIEASI